jgi:L-lactate dehydrogenase complex protein LldE
MSYHDDAAAATVEVLEHLGCEVLFPEGQTCCGQPAFNAGDWAASRSVVRHAVRTFREPEPVVVPSGSCAAMMFHGASLEFEREADLAEVEELGRRTWELADFIVNALGVRSWPGRCEGVVALHRSCHTRGTPSGDAAALLLGSIRGLRLAEFGEGEQCCGFGGTFSVGFPNISAAMGDLKLDHVDASGAAILVSGDSGCLMHLAGLAAKQGRPVRTMHLAQVLRDAFKHMG